MSNHICIWCNKLIPNSRPGQFHAVCFKEYIEYNPTMRHHLHLAYWIEDLYEKLRAREGKT